MARDFDIETLVNYSNVSGNQQASANNQVIGGAATDDGTWDVGDPVFDGSSFLYEGFFSSGGASFLVFEGPTATLLASPTAPLGAFPGNLSGVPALTTTPLAVCFAGGTLMATPNGVRPVETLQAGDAVLTADGRIVSVKWIGRQTLHKVFTPRDRFAPVRIKAGALGNGFPHADLVVTADHALIIDGFAINAGVLVNGTTIVRDAPESLPAQVTYYHIETDAHDVVLANGAPAETYVDYVQRRAFDNYAEYLELYGEERTIAEMPVPRISTARLLPESIRARLAADTAA